jgi:hypothetical protein
VLSLCYSPGRFAQQDFPGISMADHTGLEHESFDDMPAHVKTWHGFLKLVKWLLIGSGLLLLVLLIWRTNNG